MATGHCGYFLDLMVSRAINDKFGQNGDHVLREVAKRPQRQRTWYGYRGAHRRRRVFVLALNIQQRTRSPSAGAKLLDAVAATLPGAAGAGNWHQYWPLPEPYEHERWRYHPPRRSGDVPYQNQRQRFCAGRRQMKIWDVGTA